MAGSTNEGRGTGRTTDGSGVRPTAGTAETGAATAHERGARSRPARGTAVGDTTSALPIVPVRARGMTWSDRRPRRSRASVIRLLPALTITEEQAAAVPERLAGALHAAARDRAAHRQAVECRHAHREPGVREVPPARAG
ncbi:hypothetical protein ABZS79_16740 [Streptomyces griseoloalbus]|uniref:hypothetical protein n=1 Tax=Streptomyces griseoloalbus TaxID=67303 RepID=UPI0033AF7A22